LLDANKTMVFTPDSLMLGHVMLLLVLYCLTHFVELSSEIDFRNTRGNFQASEN